MPPICTLLTRHAPRWTRPWGAGAGLTWNATDLGDFERLLATWRVVLAAALMLLALATSSSVSSPLVWGLGVYGLYAVSVGARLALGTEPGCRFQLLTQSVDLAAVVAFSLVAPEFSVAGSVLFLYALLSASARWGGPACVIVVLAGLFAEYARNGWPVEAWTAGTPGAWKTALQLPSLTAIAAAFASVGYVVYVRCSDALVLSRLSESARVEGGFSASLRAVLCELCRSFDAHGARLLAHDHRSNRAFLWVLDSSVTERSLQCLEITGTVHAEANAAFAASHAAHVWREPFLVGEWTGQVILIEPGAVRTRRLSTLFTRAVRQVTPGLYDMFRTARVRSRAVARERARVARQIHDGTIQALLGTEMQLEALWNQCRQSGLDSVTGELTRIRLLMHREVLNLRDLMLQLKPLDVRVEELPELLEDMVGRFAYDSGIEASFSGRISGVDLSRRACAEIVRIVQEGLSNIRKHSGAKRVLVQLESAAGGIRLLIEDTGVGFNFDGWVQLVASDDVRPSDLAAATPAAHPHPWELAALRESVRAIDGELVLHSRRGAGARLEIIIPGKPAAVQAARRAS